MKVIGFVGDSGSGKTTLIERLIVRFAAAGLRVAAVKHAHHGFDIDQPGKDSYRFREAGAAQVLVASARRWVLMSEEGAPDAGAQLARQLARLDPCDVVLVEGFRGQPGVDYIEVLRRHDTPGNEGRPPPRAAPIGVIALASDFAPSPAGADDSRDRLDLNDIESIARYIANHLELRLC